MKPREERKPVPVADLVRSNPKLAVALVRAAL